MDKMGSINIFDSEEIIAVGDIHGEVHKLEGLIKKIWKFLDNLKCHLVFCGDYFDRGVNSPRVFEVLMELRDKKPDQIFFIKGNHEEMVWATLVDKEINWLNWTEKTLDQMVTHWDIKHPDEGGEDGYAPFGYFDWYDREDIAVVEKVCEEKGLLKFLEELLPYYENKEVICSHAPLNRHSCDSFFERNGNRKNILDSLNLQWTFIKEAKPQLVIPGIDKFLICGHQCPQGADKVDPRIFNKRAFIDTGCGLHPKRPLTAFKYPSRKTFQEF
ncbi:metallophosphoesterase [bacterium]|nr:metallophosphoesterase [bacterium]